MKLWRELTIFNNLLGMSYAYCCFAAISCEKGSIETELLKKSVQFIRQAKMKEAENIAEKIVRVVLKSFIKKIVLWSKTLLKILIKR